MVLLYVIGFYFFCWASEAYQQIDTQSDELKKNFTQVWHSYVFDSGVGNREELYIFKIASDINTPLPGSIFKWKSFQTQGETFIVGLGKNFLSVTPFTNQKSTETFKKEIQGYTKFFSIFQTWVASKQAYQSFIVVAVSTKENQDILKWYTIDNKDLVFICDWQLHLNITYLEIVKINHDLKLLIVSQAVKPGCIDSAIHLYNFNLIPNLYVWLFERIDITEVPSSLTMFSDDFNTYLAVSFRYSGTVDIWKYSKTLCLTSQKHFNFHQRIYSNDVRSVTSFRLGFFWHIATASKNSSIYQMGEDLSFNPISYFNLGDQNEWLTIPIDTYREDVLLLLKSDQKISALVWNGNENFKFVENLIDLICLNDSDCTKIMNMALLKDATTFSYNNHQNILIPTKEQTTILMNLMVKLKPLPDKISETLNELLKLKNDIQRRYEIQGKEVETLKAINKRINSNITRKEYFGTSSHHQATAKPEGNGELHTASQTKNWSNTLIALDIIKSRLNTLKETFENFTKTALNASFIIIDSKSAEIDALPKNKADKIIFEGNVVINNLDLSFLNGHDVNDLLKNSYRKDRKQKVGGIKTFKSVSAKHLKFEKINDFLACDMVFSDDPWESINGNVINGDIFWESKLNILNDFSLILRKENGSSFSMENYESFSNITKLIFDELYFEDLEITDESFVLQSINSRPMILPVHTAPLDIHYLKEINQARIETVNVFGNLTVYQLNGKNFTDILENINFKNNVKPKKYDSAKIEGILRVHSLEPQYLNSIPIKNNGNFTESKWKNFEPLKKSHDESDDFDKKYFENDDTPTYDKKILVFQDLDIDGKIFTESINNLKWQKLNNTLRKSFPTTIKGIKTFTKFLKAPQLNVSTINNEKFAEKIMTNFGEQTIEFKQKFEFLDVNNLNVNGTLNNTDLKQFNSSVSESKTNFGGNLTVEKDFMILVNNLEVTDSINNISLKDLKNEEINKDASYGDSLDMNRIKASKVVVEGSLQAHNINDVNLMNLETIRVSVRQKQSVEKNIFQSNLTLDGNLKVLSLNENDLTPIFNLGENVNIKQQFLKGQLRDLDRLLVKGNIITEEGINSYDLSNLSRNGIYVGDNSVIDGDVIFEDMITFKNLNVTNTVDGFSLKALNEDIALRHSHVFFGGTKIFKTLKVLKEMKTKYLNDHLIQDVTTLMGDHRIKGSIKINGNVVIKANITTTGKVNDVAIPQLLKSYSTELNSYLSAEDLYLKKDSITIKNLFVKGSIQNISFDDLMKNVVPKNNCCDIIGKKAFTGEVKFIGNVSVEKPINGVNLEELAADIVLMNGQKKINGTIIIKDAIFNSLHVKDYLNSKLINDFDLNEWFDESVPLDHPEVINGKMRFEKPLVVENIETNFINGHIPSAIITLKGKQFIPVLGLFQKLQVNTDLNVGGNVNGYNLPEEYEKSILVFDDQLIYKKTIFHGGIIIKGDLNIDEIEGKALKNLVTLDTEQTIQNNLNFLGTVTVKGNINNLKFINNINLKNWYERSVFLNRPQEIYGFWQIHGNVKAKDIIGGALLNNLNFTNVSKEVKRTKTMALQKKYQTEMDYQSNCHELEALSKDLIRRPYILHQFDITHVLETQSVIESIIPLKVAGSDYLIISFLNECHSIMYTWNKKNLTFTYQRHINIGPITKWLITYRNNSTYLVTSFLYTNILCEENRLPGNIWVFNENSDRYVHLLTGNNFVDIAQENETSEHFYTLEENGFVYKWTIKNDSGVEDTLLLNLGPGPHRFIDFRIFESLALTNGREIKVIKFIEGKIIINHFSLPNNDVIALPVDGKILVGVILKDKIVIYENVKEKKVFSIIQTYKVESVLWLNYGFRRQSFLVIASHHKLIEIFEYKSVSGFVKRMSLQLFSMKLQAISLLLNGKRQLGKFVLVIQKNKIIFLKADMLGDYYEGSDLFC